MIATVGLLGLVQALVTKRYSEANLPVEQYLPHDVWRWGDVGVQEERIYLVAISLVVTVGLWAWTRYTRTGLAISASAENERAVQTLGWSPDRLAALTWGLGGALAGLAAVLVAPLTGPLGHHPDDGGHRGRPGRRPARRLPVVPDDVRRRPRRGPRRGAGHPLPGRRRAAGCTRARSPGSTGPPGSSSSCSCWWSGAGTCRCGRTSPTGCRGWAPAGSTCRRCWSAAACCSSCCSACSTSRGPRPPTSRWPPA